MQEDVTIYVRRTPEEAYVPLTAPTDLGLSIMELLKASDYPIMATCGGMALCATCHIEIDNEVLPYEPYDDEMTMLDTLPVLYDTSRLSCQIRITPEVDGLKITIRGEME